MDADEPTAVLALATNEVFLVFRDSTVLILHEGLSNTSPL